MNRCKNVALNGLNQETFGELNGFHLVRRGKGEVIQDVYDGGMWIEDYNTSEYK